MKNLFLFLIIALPALLAAQQGPAQIVCETDPIGEFSQICYPSKSALIVDRVGLCAFVLTATIDEAGELMGFVTSKGVRAGNKCGKDAVLLLYTEEDEEYSVNAHSWSPYSCDGRRHFGIPVEGWEYLSRSPLRLVGLMSVDDGQMCVGTPVEGSATYIQELAASRLEAARKEK
jgi:hypothetical protein